MDQNCIKPYPLGAYAENGAVRFAFVSKREDCGVLIYDKKSGKRLYKIPFTAEERVGNIHCKCFKELPADQISYQFYEGNRIVPDPHARVFADRVPYGRERKAHDLKALIPSSSFEWGDDKRPKLPYRDCVCYCAHVRGFTKHASSGVAHRGTFAGMAEKLDYLQETGITTVELQPAYEFTELATDEERRELLGAGGASAMASTAELDRLMPKKVNYWGYKMGYYYAPKAAYAAAEDASTEFKEMVRAFHKRGMELVMQFYFPRNVKYIQIVDILKYWVMEYHVDGFHLMGYDLPVELIALEPLLADTKLWYYYFDTDRIYEPQETPEYCNLACYSDEFIYPMRRFLKGDEYMLDAALEQMRRIPPKMGRIHYMSNYFGLTLKDMVCYERKHNEANGEENRDGNDYNCSWNCGEEGPTKRKKVQALRDKQVRNAMVMLMFSQSTPLIFMGDEFGNSQKGNNNPYCQDNNVAWLNWNDLEKNAETYRFWLKLVEFRREHPILHPEKACRLMDSLSCNYPDLSYHGENAWRPRTEGYYHHIGLLYCGKYAKNKKNEEDAFLYLALNMHWERKSLGLPKLPAGMRWKLVLSTEAAAAETASSVLTGNPTDAGRYGGALEKGDARPVAAKRPAALNLGPTDYLTGTWSTAMPGEDTRPEEVSESKIQVPPRSCAVYIGVADAEEPKKKRRSVRKRAEEPAETGQTSRQSRGDKPAGSGQTSLRAGADNLAGSGQTSQKEDGEPSERRQISLKEGRWP